MDIEEERSRRYALSITTLASKVKEEFGETETSRDMEQETREELKAELKVKMEEKEMWIYTGEEENETQSATKGVFNVTEGEVVENVDSLSCTSFCNTDSKLNIKEEAEEKVSSAHLCVQNKKVKLECIEKYEFKPIITDISVKADSKRRDLKPELEDVVHQLMPKIETAQIYRGETFVKDEESGGKSQSIFSHLKPTKSETETFVSARPSTSQQKVFNSVKIDLFKTEKMDECYHLGEDAKRSVPCHEGDSSKVVPVSDVLQTSGTSTGEKIEDGMYEEKKPKVATESQHQSTDFRLSKETVTDCSSSLDDILLLMENPFNEGRGKRSTETIGEEEEDGSKDENGSRDEGTTYRHPRETSSNTVKKAHSCKACGNVLKSAYGVGVHQRKRRGERECICSTCGKTFIQVGNLRRHERIDAGEKPNACSKCGKAFRHAEGLRKHELIHTGEKPYACSTCGKAFTEAGNLRKHESIHAGEKPYTCSTCGKTFRKAGKLRSHESIHTGEKPYACSTCGKAFTEAGNLRKHESIHTGEKPYTCSTCGKAFRRADILRTHELIHTGEKSYACSTCGKAFRHAGRLRTHELIHAGEKPYACSTCGKAFRHAGSLRTHEFIHAGEKPYACSTCGNAFTQAMNLRTHELIHT